MMKERRLVLGKIDYNNSGRRNCEAALTWSLENGRFSMSAEVWNPRKTNLYMAGQCVDTVVAYFPLNAKASRMLSIWRQWHLNDMNAGTPAQEAELNLRANLGQKVDSYMLAKEALAEAGLDPDPNYMHNGKPYSYGSAWLKRELPADVVAEIESWG